MLPPKKKIKQLERNQGMDRIETYQKSQYLSEDMLLDSPAEDAYAYSMLLDLKKKMTQQEEEMRTLKDRLAQAEAKARVPPPPPPPVGPVQEEHIQVYRQKKQGTLEYFQTVCRVAKLRLELVQVLLRIDPTAAARILLHREDITARNQAGVLQIQECKQVEITKMYLDHKVNDTCFGELPVETNLGLMFLRQDYIELGKYSWEISCSDLSIMAEVKEKSRKIKEIRELSDKTQKPPWHENPVDYGSQPRANQISMEKSETYVETWLNYLVINRDTVTKWATQYYLTKKMNNVHQSQDDQGIERKRVVWNEKAENAAETIVAVSVLLMLMVVTLPTAIICCACCCCASGKCNRRSQERNYERYMISRNRAFTGAKHADPKNLGSKRGIWECVLGLMRWWTIISNETASKDTKVSAVAAVRTENANKLANCDVETNEWSEIFTIPRVYAVHSKEAKPGELVPRIPMDINGTTVQCLVDTGATTSYCGVTIAKILGIDSLKTNKSVQARAADGSKFTLFGQKEVRIRIGSKLIKHKLYISDDRCCPEPVLLGADFLFTLNQNEMDVSFNMLKNTVRLGNTVYHITGSIPKTQVFRIDARDMRTNDIPVEMVETILVPPRTEMIIPLQIDSVLFKNGMQYVIEDNQRESVDIYVLGASLANPNNEGRCVGLVMNPSQTSVTLYKGCRIGLAHEIQPETEDATYKRVNYTEYNSPELTWQADLPKMPQPRPPHFDIAGEVSICPAVPQKWKDQIKTLIRKNEHVFIGPDGMLGHYTGPIRHRIDMKDENVVPQAKIYRIPLEKRKVVEEQVEEMLRQGIIQPSESPFAAPIVLVRKPDQSWRFTVDFRALNAQTKLAQSILPNIQDIIDLTASKTVYTTLDFGSGFHQIDMQQEHCERTAFGCFLGAFEYIRMPMGLSGAPGTFQKVMNNMVKGMRARAFVYVDDLIVVSDDMETHLKDLEEVFDRVGNLGMKLKPGKCKIAYPEVAFLGFLISEEGIKPNPKKVQSIKDYPQPKNLKQLRSFLGMASFFRRFIDGFSLIAGPLTELTRKDKDFVWGTEQQEAFEQLKETLISAPVLVPPKLGKPFTIETDASGRGLAAVLRQGEGKNAPVVAYASRATNKHESRYAALELEGLAIVYALKEFRPYVDGAKITVVTDHASLRAMLRSRNIEGRLGKYQLQIQHYDLEIIYRPGKKNHLCDALSRNLPETEETQPGLEKTVNAIKIPLWKTILDNARVREIQKDTPHIATLLEEMQDIGFGNMGSDPLLESYVVVDGILYQIPDEMDKRPVIVLSKDFEEKERLIKAFHEFKLGTSHLGMNKTTGALSDIVSWIGMKKDVEDVIRKCAICQRVKNVSAYTTVEPLGVFEAVDQPNHRLHIDHVGPLPKTLNGNMYILTIIDASTRYAQAIPVADTKSVTSVDALIERWISVHGCPHTIVTDCGTSFVSEVFQNTMKMLRIRHVQSRPYHHQTNGLVERYNQTIEKMIATTKDQATNDWDAHLPWLTLSHNTTEAAATGYTPFFMTFGRQHSNPLVADLGIPRKRYFDVEDYVQNLRFMLDTVREAVEVRSEQVKEKEAGRYNLRNRTKVSQYRVGDKVVEKIVRANKLSPQYGEPATVTDISYPDITIQAEHGRKRRIHMDNVKIFHE